MMNRIEVKTGLMPTDEISRPNAVNVTDLNTSIFHPAHHLFAIICATLAIPV